MNEQLSAQAAIKKIRDLAENDCGIRSITWRRSLISEIKKIASSVDLSLLHQHDSEIRKPLVNVLLGIRIALDRIGGFEATKKNIDNALATIKDL